MGSDYRICQRCIMDTSDPENPKIIHGFMPRDAAGYQIKQTWDVMGMRATQSEDTILEGAFVPDRYVARIVPAGAAGVDDGFVLLDAQGEVALDKLVGHIGEPRPQGVAVRAVTDGPPGNSAKADLEQLEPLGILAASLIPA